MEMTLGKRIAMLRKQRELKQDDLAQMLNVSAQAVSKWENDQTCPDIGLLPLLAKILNVSVDELLTGESRMQNSVQMVPVAERKRIEEMILRVVVDSVDGDRVRVNLPMALVQTAIDMGVELSQLSGKGALQNIDLSQIMQLVQQGVVGNLVEAESAEGDVVRIYVE